MSWMSSCGSSAWLAMSRYLASESWPWPRMALACVSSSCGRWRFGERPVAFAADREQQRVDAGGVDGVDADDAGQHGGNHRAGEFVDELAEDRVFLRRAADDGERPDRAVAVVDVFDSRARGSRARGCSSRGDRRTGLRGAACWGSTVPQMQKSVSAWIGRPSVRRSMRMRRPPSAPANLSSLMPSGSGITAASIIAGGPPTKMFTRNGLPARRAAAWWTPIERWI